MCHLYQKTSQSPRENVSLCVNWHTPSNIPLPPRMVFNTLHYTSVRAWTGCKPVFHKASTGICGSCECRDPQLPFVILHLFCWLHNLKEKKHMQTPGDAKNPRKKNYMTEFKNWICISYRYSAPHPFTKLILMVHILVSWYTASKPWLTDWARRAANSWLLKIFRLQPMIEKSKNCVKKTTVRRSF